MNSLTNCWDSLPRDLIIYVFRSGMQAEDFGQLQKVCKMFKSIIESVEMRRDWEKELKGKFLVFRQSYGRVPLDADWRTYYVKEANLILRISKAKVNYISDTTDEKLLTWARLLIQREDINTNQSHCKLLWRDSEFKEDVRFAFHQLVLQGQEGDSETEYLIGRLALASTDRVAFPFKYLYQAAKQGYEDAYLHLGKIPVKHKSLLRNTEKCFIGKEAKHEVLNFLKIAADSGNVKAQYFIYRYTICFNGKYEGLKYLKMAAEQEYPKALNMMGVYLRNECSNVNPTEIVKYFSHAAQKGCRAAMGNLAVCYENGFGTEKDISEAVRYASLAAERGDNQGKFLLGRYLEEGIYVKKDLVAAMNYYHLAAEGGFKDAQFLLAKYYFTGHNTQRNQHNGFYYLQLASYQNHQNAHYIEAYCHENGIGTVQDLSEALRNYKLVHNFPFLDRDTVLNLIVSEKACAQNFGITDYVPSLLKLAHFYEMGKGTVPKPDKASRYYALAAAYSIK